MREEMKAVVHGGILTLATICLVYNAPRKKPWNKFLTLFYGFVIGVEARCVGHHLKGGDE